MRLDKSRNMNVWMLFLVALLVSVPGGRSQSQSRIVGGFPANDLYIPYIASVQQYGYHSCGGSILNARTVITAAHCLAPATPRIVRIKVGGKTRAAEDGQLYAVAALHYHENWSPTTMDYDIGVVRLSSAIVFGDKVQPIAIGRSSAPDGTFATIAGWGFTSVFGPGTETLRYARVPIVNQEVCNRLYKGLVTERMLCAGYLRGGVDACQMDSGGPLVVHNRLQGIVSWGIGCALANKPGIYARVEALLPWLDDLMAQRYNEIL